MSEIKCNIFILNEKKIGEKKGKEMKIELKTKCACENHLTANNLENTGYFVYMV